jgi:hypothetical protein
MKKEQKDSHLSQRPQRTQRRRTNGVKTEDYKLDFSLGDLCGASEAGERKALIFFSVI